MRIARETTKRMNCMVPVDSAIAETVEAYVVPSISLRENERGMHTGAGWNPHWHQRLVS
jgi:hypothetical protein